MDEYLSKKIKVISFISIVMVIYIHALNLTGKHSKNINEFIQNFISDGIGRVAVPLFFMISGYLFFINFKPTTEGFITKFKKRFYTLIIPFLFWSIWGILFFFIIQLVPVTRNFFNGDLVKNYSIIKVIYTIFINPLPYQLWFLIELVKYVIMTPIINIYISKFSYYSLIPLACLWFFDINLLVIRNDGILFFIIGCLLAIKHININKITEKRKKEAYILTFIWVIILLFKTYFTLENVYFAKYMLKVSIVIGILVVWKLYDVCIIKEVEKTRIFHLTEYTFFIFASHEPILTIIKKTMLKILGVSQISNLIVYLICPIITIGFAITIAMLLKQYAKTLYKIITGNRMIKTNEQYKERHYKHFANESI